MAFSLLTSALNGCHLIHDVGYLESGLCSANESIVFADELIGYTKRILRTFKITEETLALDVIDDVGPQGHFLDHDHTLDHYRDDVWRPTVLDRRTHDVWSAHGSRPITDPLREQAREILATQKPPELTACQLRAMADILTRRD